jgi:hypothetical protein
MIRSGLMTASASGGGCGCAVTSICATPVMPPSAARISAMPGLSAVASPLAASTPATAGALELQLTPVAGVCVLPSE